MPRARGTGSACWELQKQSLLENAGSWRSWILMDEDSGATKNVFLEEQ